MPSEQTAAVSAGLRMRSGSVTSTLPVGCSSASSVTWACRGRRGSRYVTPHATTTLDVRWQSVIR